MEMTDKSVIESTRGVVSENILFLVMKKRFRQKVNDQGSFSNEQKYTSEEFQLTIILPV